MCFIEKITSRFYHEFVYRQEHFERDYMREFHDFDLAKWEPTVRGARLSALTKNYKTSEMLVFTLYIASEESLDLTPLVVKRLNKALFGRTGSQGLIVELVGCEGRIHRSKDAIPERIEELAQRYKTKADEHWKQCATVIELVKDRYRKATADDLNQRMIEKLERIQKG